MYFLLVENRVSRHDRLHRAGVHKLPLRHFGHEIYPGIEQTRFAEGLRPILGRRSALSIGGKEPPDGFDKHRLAVRCGRPVKEGMLLEVGSLPEKRRATKLLEKGGFFRGVYIAIENFLQKALPPGATSLGIERKGELECSQEAVIRIVADHDAIGKPHKAIFKSYSGWGFLKEAVVVQGLLHNLHHPLAVAMGKA